MSLAKEVVPVRLRRAIRSAHRELASKTLFEGVYASFDEVPSQGPAFANEQWVLDSERSIRAMLDKVKLDPWGSNWRYEHHERLSFLIACLAKKPVRIVDFGGGFGPDFVHLLHSLSDPARVEYTILETEDTVRKASAFWSQLEGPAPKYAQDWAQLQPDIVFSNAAIQYVSDWKSVANSMAAASPEFILFARLPLGQFESYVGGQKNHPPFTVPVWFFGMDEFKCVWRDLGYEITWMGIHDRIYDQSNYPAELRCLRRSAVLLRRLGAQ